MNYKTVDGIDEKGNPTTFKVEISALSEIKEMVERTGFNSWIYKACGYVGYELCFEKADGKYSAYEHLSTESGREEDIGIYVKADSFDELVEKLKQETNYFGEPFFNDKGELL